MSDVLVQLAKALANTKELPPPDWLPPVDEDETVLDEKAPPWLQAVCYLVKQRIDAALARPDMSEHIEALRGVEGAIDFFAGTLLVLMKEFDIPMVGVRKGWVLVEI